MGSEKTKESKWDLASASACVKRNGGKISGRRISATKSGIKVLGAIDYLVKYHKFIKFSGGK